MIRFQILVHVYPTCMHLTLSVFAKIELIPTLSGPIKRGLENVNKYAVLVALTSMCVLVVVTETDVSLFLLFCYLVLKEEEEEKAQ